MTVYELIQELAQCEATSEVVIDFTINEINVEIEEGKFEGDTVTVDAEEKTGKDINVCSYGFDNRKKVHIEVEEDQGGIEMLIRSQDGKDIVNLDKTYRLGVVENPVIKTSSWFVYAENQFCI